MVPQDRGAWVALGDIAGSTRLYWPKLLGPRGLIPRRPALPFGPACAAGRRGVPMPLPVTFDHCVVHVSDWERSNAFYRDVLGAELVRRPQGWAYRFGAA